MRLPFVPEALEEFEAAAANYERERPAYGALFVSEVRSRVDRAAELPQSGRPIAGLDPTRDHRAFGLKRFPYLVIVGIVGGVRAVVAVAHTRREPAYWSGRRSAP